MAAKKSTPTPAPVEAVKGITSFKDQNRNATATVASLEARPVAPVAKGKPKEVVRLNDGTIIENY